MIAVIINVHVDNQTCKDKFNFYSICLFVYLYFSFYQNALNRLISEVRTHAKRCLLRRSDHHYRMIGSNCGPVAGSREGALSVSVVVGCGLPWVVSSAANY